VLKKEKNTEYTEKKMEYKDLFCKTSLRVSDALCGKKWGMELWKLCDLGVLIRGIGCV
jgi:hypothetical protein